MLLIPLIKERKLLNIYFKNLLFNVYCVFQKISSQHQSSLNRLSKFNSVDSQSTFFHLLPAPISALQILFSPTARWGRKTKSSPAYYLRDSHKKQIVFFVVVIKVCFLYWLIKFWQRWIGNKNFLCFSVLLSSLR